MNVIFVKFGSKYNADHVNRLSRQLKQYISGEYWCYTDNPVGVEIQTIAPLDKPKLRGVWNKLALFAPEMPFKGPCFYIDLDSVVLSNPYTLLKFQESLRVMEDYGKKDFTFKPQAFDTHINSSVMSWQAGSTEYIWNHFLTNIDYFVRKYPGIDRFIWNEKEITVETFDEELVSSVKNNRWTPSPIHTYDNMDFNKEIMPPVNQKAFELIMQLYEDSKYGETDLFRINDIANHLVQGQVDSKLWLTKELLKVRDTYDNADQRKRDMIVMGGWYGLLAHMLRQYNGEEDSYVMSVDTDQGCEWLGYKLYPTVEFRTGDAAEIFEEEPERWGWIINTSVEHMDPEDVQFIIRSKEEYTWCCFQSNNGFDEPSHINCSNSLEEFVESLGLDFVAYQGEIEAGSFTRYMVIGR